MSFKCNETIEQFQTNPDASLSVSGEANVLKIVRCGVRVQVTVPVDVLEWFADAFEEDAPIVEDWWDYEGYDKTTREELARLMSSDIENFVSGLLTRNIRLATRPETRMDKFASKLKLLLGKQSVGRVILEWEIDRVWQQALPFC